MGPTSPRKLRASAKGTAPPYSNAMAGSQADNDSLDMRPDEIFEKAIIGYRLHQEGRE